MVASVDKMVADQGTVGARLPQGAPNRAQSEKAENALARRIALQDKFATGVLFAIVAAICVLLFSLIAYIVASGAGKLLDVSFLTGKPEQFKEGGGIGPELFNSFYLLVLTLLISVPIALGGAIYLTEYAPKNRLTHFVKTAIEALSSLPSIVVGLFGFLFFVLQMGWGFSILSGALALTMFNLPILVRVIQQALEAIPNDQREGGLALGASRWETTIHVLLPAALPAIITGIILSAGRCVRRGGGPHLYSGPVGADARFHEFRFFECVVSVECVPPGGRRLRCTFGRLTAKAWCPIWMRFRAVPLRCSWCAFWHSTCLPDSLAAWRARIHAKLQKMSRSPSILDVALIFGSRDSFLPLSRLAAKLPIYNCMSWWRAGCRKRKGRA